MDKILYLGLDPSHVPLQGSISHYPVIKIVRKMFDDPRVLLAKKVFDQCTHVIFTSKSGVQIFFTLFKEMSLKDKRIFSVGKITTKILLEYGVDRVTTAIHECQEGVIDMLMHEDLAAAHFFLPGSVLARPLLRQFLEEKNIPYVFCPLYETKMNKVHPLPNLEAFDAVVFTSPSTVHAFFSSFRLLPFSLKCIAQGDVTKKVIVKLYKKEEDSILTLNF